jgi:hypothetical protein
LSIQRATLTAATPLPSTIGHQSMLPTVMRRWVQFPNTQVFSQTPGGGRPGFPPGPGQLMGTECPMDSWFFLPLLSHLFKGDKKGAGLFFLSCFWKLSWVIWARVRLLAVPKPINALLAASHLYLLIQHGSPPPLLKLFCDWYPL